MSGWIDKAKTQMTSRRLLFIAAGLLIVVLIGRSCSGVDISEEQAIAAATAAFEANEGYFEPEKVEARVLRQGFPARPVWFVVFTVPDPNGSRNDFLHHASVQVNAGNGAVVSVEITEMPG